MVLLLWFASSHLALNLDTILKEGRQGDLIKQ
jgi:hypothetical protein